MNPRQVLAARLASLGHALRGLVTLLRTEANARLHAAATALVLAAGLALQVSARDWRWLVLSVTLVWAAEAFNTALERLCDRVSPGHDPLVRQAKDLAAAAVLVTAAGAAALGLLVLWPYLAGPGG